MEKVEQSDVIPISSTDIIVIAGQRGSGKTVLMKSLIAGNEPEFERQTKEQLGVAKKFIKIDPLMEFGGIYVSQNDRVTYNNILKKAFETKNEFIVTDEADFFFPNKVTLSNLQNEFINIGRHWGLGGMFVTRRLPRLHTDLVSNANKIFLFKLWTSADLEHLKRCNLGNFTEIVSRLEQYQFLGIDMVNNTFTVYDPI